MNQELLIQQTKVESQALEHTTRALETTIEWAVDGADYFQKLSSVRFFTELYQRHLERLFALEEVDGYMESVARLNPGLRIQVNDLQQQHEQFRTAIRKIMIRLDLAAPNHFTEIEATCRELRRIISRILEHIRRERELLVESVQPDSGGEPE
jgi:hypothetical protein